MTKDLLLRRFLCICICINSRCGGGSSSSSDSELKKKRLSVLAIWPITATRRGVDQTDPFVRPRCPAIRFVVPQTWLDQECAYAGVRAGFLCCCCSNPNSSECPLMIDIRRTSFGQSVGGALAIATLERTRHAQRPEQHACGTLDHTHAVSRPVRHVAQEWLITDRPRNVFTAAARFSLFRCLVDSI
jgi:hypothetical protein